MKTFRRILWVTLLLPLFSLAQNDEISSSNADRIVVAGGSLTEIIYALNAEDTLVGIDDSSQYPPQVRALPSVGYYRTLNVEGVLSVSPNTLLLLQGSGPKNVINQLKSLGLDIVQVDNPKSVEGLLNTILQVANTVNKPEAGKRLAQQVKQDIESAVKAAHVAKNPIHKKAVFLMSAGERGLIAAGRDTAPQLIFDLLNITNPFASLSGFKPISAESLAASRPDTIFIASHTSAGQDTANLCRSPQLILWAKEAGCNLHKVDSLKFLGMTPRLAQALIETNELVRRNAN